MTRQQAFSHRPRGAVFLDRDGVINAYLKGGYVTSWAKFKFLPGVLGALRLLREKRRLVIILSNQSAVARGLMTNRQLVQITRRMRQVVRNAGGQIHAVYCCPHHPQEGCACRKPRPGLLRKACRRFSIDLKRSTVVGDNPVDILMGKANGCRTVLVLSGKLNRGCARRLKVAPDRTVKDLAAAVRWILKQERQLITKHKVPNTK